MGSADSRGALSPLTRLGAQGTGRAADLIAEALEIYEEELMRGGADDSDAPDVAVMQRNQAPPRRPPFR